MLFNVVSDDVNFKRCGPFYKFDFPVLFGTVFLLRFYLDFRLTFGSLIYLDSYVFSS